MGILLFVLNLNKKMAALEQVGTGDYVPNEFKEEGYRMLAVEIHKMLKELEPENIVTIGHPSEVIIDTCKEGRYHLIVMGSRGVANMQQLFMGSVNR
ncbi:MAG: UspA protein [Firmicutes bacterium]|nr:UspA protein [Bacillota bacterium]